MFKTRPRVIEVSQGRLVQECEWMTLWRNLIQLEVCIQSLNVVQSF